jgi:LysM repeat protein
MSVPPKDKEEIDNAGVASEVSSLLARTSLSSLLARSPAKSSHAAKRVENAPAGYQYHVVTKSDTLAGIAVRYQTSTEELKKVNKLWAERDMFVRNSLLVPVVLDEAELARERAAKLARFIDVVGRDRCDDNQGLALLAKVGWSVERAVAAFEEMEETDRVQQQHQLDAAERAQRDAVKSSENGFVGSSLTSSYSSAEEEVCCSWAELNLNSDV